MKNGVFLKDIANELNINIKELNELINKLEIKIKKNPTNGAEIKETRDFINIFINLLHLKVNAEPNKVIEFFKNNIKKTKNYKDLNNSKLDKIINDIQLLLENPEKFKNKIEQQEFYSIFNNRENLEKLQKTKNIISTRDNIHIPLPHLLTLKEKFEKQTNQTNIIEFKNIKKINIKIDNLKNIKNLQNFEINLNNDIYVLTGNNGIGKSTLLAALGQLVNKNSLSQEFQGNMFDETKISYELVNNENTTIKIFYKKFKESTQTKRWQAYSENGKEIYPEKLNGFIESGIEGERLNKFTKEQRQKILEEIEKLNIDSISKEEKLTNYFQNITGKNYQFFIYKSKSSNKDVIIYKIENKYLPEFNLSTGEYFILQILHQLIKKINKTLPSLVILDEIELALNPKLQIKFVEFLKKEFCQKNNTTFLLATQSIAFIDNVNHVFLMRNIDGKVKIFDNFKGKIIKTYLGENKTIYDKIIIVEDILAKFFIEKLIEDISSKYLFIIFPFGGKDQIKKHFTEEQLMTLFANELMIIYDGDVEEDLIYEIKENLKKLKIDIDKKSLKDIKKELKSLENSKKKEEVLRTFEKIKGKYIFQKIYSTFLPILNVEKYIVNLIREENKQFINKIHPIINNSTFFDIKDNLKLNDNTDKTIFKDFVKELSKHSFNSEYDIIKKLVSIIIEINQNNPQFEKLKNSIESFLQK